MMTPTPDDPPNIRIGRTDPEHPVTQHLLRELDAMPLAHRPSRARVLLFIAIAIPLAAGWCAWAYHLAQSTPLPVAVFLALIAGAVSMCCLGMLVLRRHSGLVMQIVTAVVWGGGAIAVGVTLGNWFHMSDATFMVVIPAATAIVLFGAVWLLWGVFRHVSNSGRSAAK